MTDPLNKMPFRSRMTIVVVASALFLGGILLAAPMVWSAGLSLAVEPGDDDWLVIPVVLEANDTEGVSGIQFDLSIENAGYRIEEIYTGESAEAGGKDVLYTENSDGAVRVLIAGFNLDTLEEGPVAYVALSREDENATLDQVGLQDVVFSDAAGNPVPTEPDTLDSDVSSETEEVEKSLDDSQTETEETSVTAASSDETATSASTVTGGDAVLSEVSPSESATAEPSSPLQAANVTSHVPGAPGWVAPVPASPETSAPPVTAQASQANPAPSSLRHAPVYPHPREAKASRFARTEDAPPEADEASGKPGERALRLARVKMASVPSRVLGDSHVSSAAASPVNRPKTPGQYVMWLGFFLFLCGVAVTTWYELSMRHGRVRR